MTFLLFSYIMGIEVITMKIGDRVVVARHIACGDGYIFDEMIDTKGKIVGLNGSRALVEFTGVKPNGEKSSTTFSFQLEQLDVING